MNYDREAKYINKEVVVIKADRKSKYHITLHKTGRVVRCSGPELGVSLDGLYNEASSKGLFWFKPYEIEFVEKYENNGGNKMKGNFKIAVVTLAGDYSQRYGFALYEDAQIGDLVVVNPRSSYSLGKIVNILTKEEYGGRVTKEVIGVVSMDVYNKRVEERELAAKLEKEKKELQKELDKRISKLKDIEYYEKMAKELADKDPELVEMASRLKTLTVQK